MFKSRIEWHLADNINVHYIKIEIIHVFQTPLTEEISSHFDHAM